MQLCCRDADTRDACTLLFIPPLPGEDWEVVAVPLAPSVAIKVFKLETERYTALVATQRTRLRHSPEHQPHASALPLKRLVRRLARCVPQA
jgi:hypothetical protein